MALEGFTIAGAVAPKSPAPSAAASSGNALKGFTIGASTPSITKIAPVDTTSFFGKTLKSLGLPSTKTANSTVATMRDIPKPKTGPVFEARVGENLTPEQKATADQTITQSSYDAPGQSIKVPFVDAGIDVPSQGQKGMVYDQFKSFIEAPEKAGRSLSELAGITKPNSEARASAFTTPSYAETGSKVTADVIDTESELLGIPANEVPIAYPVALGAGSAFGAFANDALLYSGILESGMRAVTSKVAVPAESQLVAWDTLGRPKTAAEAEAAYRQLAKDFTHEKTLTEKDFAKVNGAIAIIRKEGVPDSSIIKKGIDAILSRPVQDLFKGSKVPNGYKPDVQIKGYLEAQSRHTATKETLTKEIKAYTAEHGEEVTRQALVDTLGLDIATADKLMLESLAARTPAEMRKVAAEVLAQVAPESVKAPVEKPESQVAERGSETSTPSHKIEAQSPEGTDTSVSPSSRKTALGTRESFGSRFSSRYTVPSTSKNLSGRSAIPEHITTMRQHAQDNKDVFTEHLQAATGHAPDVRVKAADSLEGKIKRTLKEGKKVSDVNDVLAARIITSKEDAAHVLENIHEHYDVERVKNYNQKPNEYGYRGANVVVKLPNGSLSEIQIHSPESLEIATKIHRIYEKWRNVKNDASMTRAQLEALDADIIKSNKIAEKIWKEGVAAKKPKAKSEVPKKKAAEVVKGKTKYQQVKERLDTRVKEVKARGGEMDLKQAHGESMEHSAYLRQLRGEPTGIEIRNAVKYLEGARVGKAVKFEGKSGTVVSKPAYGRVKIEFKDGTEQSVYVKELQQPNVTVDQAIKYLKTEAEKNVLARIKTFDDTFKVTDGNAPEAVAAVEPPPLEVPQEVPENVAPATIADTQVPIQVPEPVETPAPVLPPTAENARIPKLTQRIQAKLKETLEDVEAYGGMNMDEQSDIAANIIVNDYARAKRIALGLEAPPAGLRVGSMFKAVEEEAVLNGDVELQRQLGTAATTRVASAYGQEIKAFDGRDPFSPVQAITDVAKVREKAFEGRVKNTTIKKAKAAEVARIKSKMQKTAPTKETWDSFIDSITC